MSSSYSSTKARWFRSMLRCSFAFLHFLVAVANLVINISAINCLLGSSWKRQYYLLTVMRYSTHSFTRLINFNTVLHHTPVIQHKPISIPENTRVRYEQHIIIITITTTIILIYTLSQSPNFRSAKCQQYG